MYALSSCFISAACFSLFIAFPTNTENFKFSYKERWSPADIPVGINPELGLNAHQKICTTLVHILLSINGEKYGKCPTTNPENTKNSLLKVCTSTMNVWKVGVSLCYISMQSCWTHCTFQAKNV